MSALPSVSQSGRQRELGLERAAQSAGDAWRRRAQGYVREFIARSDGAPFLAEQVREYAESLGFESPSDARAWGVVMQDARRAGLVRAAGYLPARSSNLSPKRSWVAL